MNRKQIHEKMMHSIHQKETVDGVAKKCINSTLNQYEIYGNSEQDTCGDNLISTALSLTEQTLNGITCIKEEDGSYTFSGISTAKTTFRSALKATDRQLFKVGTYYIPEAIGSNNCRLGLNFYTAASGGSLVQKSPQIGERKFTLTQNLYLAQWYLYFSGDIGTEYNFKFFPQITKIDTTDHIPYVTRPTPNNLSEIESVGTLTSNILPYPYSDSINSYNGITITDNGDGTLTINGTSTARSCFYFLNSNNKLNLEAGIYTPKLYVISGSISRTSGLYYQVTASIDNTSKYYTDTFTLDTDTKVGARLDINQNGEGVTFDNYRIGVVLVRGNTATLEYEPYNKYKIPVKVGGRNFFRTNDIEETTEKGVTYSIKDNVITLKGATTDKALWLNLPLPSILPKNLYYIRMNIDNTTNLLSKIYVRYGSNYSQVTGSSTVLGGFNNSYGVVDSVALIVIQVQPNTTIDTKIKIGIGYKASDISVYEPYIPSETYNIYLDEPLRGIGNYKDKIDFRSGTVIRNIKFRQFNGTESWNSVCSLSNEDGTNNAFLLNLSDCVLSSSSYHSKGNLIYSNIYPEVACSVIENSITNGIAIHGTIRRIELRDKINRTLAEYKTYLAELDANGTPMKIVYAIQTPIVETIELPRLPQVKGTTYYSIDTDVPSEFIGTYKYKN